MKSIHLNQLPKPTVAVAIAVALSGWAGGEPAAETAADNSSIWPYIESPVGLDQGVEQRIDSMLADMTVEQKIAQMIQPEIRDITVDDMRKYGFGSYLNAGLPWRKRCTRHPLMIRLTALAFQPCGVPMRYTDTIM